MAKPIKIRKGTTALNRMRTSKDVPRPNVRRASDPAPLTPRQEKDMAQIRAQHSKNYVLKLRDKERADMDNRTKNFKDGPYQNTPVRRLTKKGTMVPDNEYTQGEIEGQRILGTAAIVAGGAAGALGTKAYLNKKNHPPAPWNNSSWSSHKKSQRGY